MKEGGWGGEWYRGRDRGGMTEVGKKDEAEREDL